jgi:hypothetical protein
MKEPAMHTIAPDQLLAVVGGKSTTTSADGTTTYQQSNYETCVGAMEHGAAEKYPDNRWFFQRWVGAKDDNAGPRADWLKDAIPKACGPAPKG